MTYSVVARDATSGDLVVACQSHYFNVGREVNSARAGVGAIANQSIIEPRYAQIGMAALQAGATAGQALAAGLAADPGSAVRQVAIVDTLGEVATHTGSGCVGAAGSHQGDGWSVQGNMLVDQGVIDAMAEVMTDAALPLVDRVLAALAAAESSGGDARGSQSAGLLAVSGSLAGLGDDGVLLDLRVVDAPAPIAELSRLVQTHRDVQTVLGIVNAEGFLGGEFREPDGGTEEALTAFGEIAARDGEPGVDAQLWGTVLLARAGRPEAATAAAQALVARRPTLEGFLDNLVGAGFLDRSPL